MIQIFLADGLTNGLTKVFHEALADLKIKHLVLLPFVLPELFVTSFDHLIIWRVCGVFHDDEDDDGDDYKDDVSSIRNYTSYKSPY